MQSSANWLAWAGTLNQMALLPFLALLLTLWHIPTLPRKTLYGFCFYLVFIAVGIPAGIYCRQHLGTSMANVDWIHGEAAGRGEGESMTEHSVCPHETTRMQNQ